jgi:hypothetical protein
MRLDVGAKDGEEVHLPEVQAERLGRERSEAMMSVETDKREDMQTWEFAIINAMADRKVGNGVIARTSHKEFRAFFMRLVDHYLEADAR